MKSKMACTEFKAKSLTATILLPHFYSMIKPVEKVL